MRKIVVSVALLLGVCCGVCNAAVDTLRISHKYTTHVIFASDLTYGDVSNNKVVAGKIIEQNKNMLALKAREPFEELSSVSVLESSGEMHTFIIKYVENPDVLVYDFRKPAVSANTGVYVSPTAQLLVDAKKREAEANGRPVPETPGKGAGSQVGNVSSWKSGRAPVLSEIIEEPQRLYHIACKEYDIQAMCEDISSYSDITYMILSVKNSSGISYGLSSATFVIESKSNNRKRTVKMDKTVFPRSSHGKLSAAPGEYTRAVYSFDKLTLSKDQVLKVYFYEDSGQRNLVLSISADDVNKARSTLS